MKLHSSTSDRRTSRITFKRQMLLMQAQENRVALDEEQLLFIAGGQDNAVDEDVDEQPTMFMANLLSADPVYDEASLSYDSDILSEDLIKMKVEALKEQTTTSRPIKALTVYPPNTPTTLVPRVLPTKKLEAEVDQNVVNRKHDEIERKNLLIANDNLIDDCLSKEVFYIAINSELTVSRFTEMHDAHTVVQARCLELEAWLSKLHDKVQKDDHNELVKCFLNLEKPLSRYQRRNQQYRAVPISLPISPENQAIVDSMQSAIAYANQ
ncbi:hypothetical protein Tco_1212969 [Tanacetum coccineum]